MTVVVTTLAVTVFGYLAMLRLPIDLLPDLSYPTLTVQTLYPDAAPISVEQFVTRPIEESVGVIPGVRDMRSISRAGISEVVLEFGWDQDMDMAALDVREKVGLAQLPREVDVPRVLRFDPSLDPILRLAFGGDRPLDEMRQIAERWVKPRLEAVEGIAAAKVRGGLDPEIEVQADEDRLAAWGLTLDDLGRTLQAENVNRPGGTLKDWGSVYLVRTLNEFDDLDQIRRTVVRETPRGRVRVEDVATVTRGHRDRVEITRSGGREAVEIALHREGSANTIAVAAAVREELATLESEMPPGLRLTVLTDQSRYIAEAVGRVWSAAILGGILAIFVLFFFLRDPVATGIIAITMPISVLATFLPMHRAGVTLNIMSLGGLALGVGMLVDNSIVVLEAIDRRRREGRSRREAAILGAGEVATAVTASTLTTVAVFLPIVFVRGVAGQLFYDLAVTVCLSLLASLAVSLTLIPSLASLDPAAHRATAGAGPRDESRLVTILAWPLRKLLFYVFWIVGRGWWVFTRLFGGLVWPASRAFELLGTRYPRMLAVALAHRRLVLATGFVLFALSLAAIPMLGTQLVPDLAQGEFAFRLRLPEGTPLETTDQLVARIEGPLASDPMFARIFSVVGSLPSAASGQQTLGENLAQIDFVLAEENGRADEGAAAERVRRVLQLFPDVEAELVHPSVLTIRSPVAVKIFADDLNVLDKAALRIADGLRRIPGVEDLALTVEPGSPEVRIEIDRERAGALNLSADDVSRSLRRQIRGEVVGQFREAEVRLDIRVRASEASRRRAADVSALRLRLADGTAVPISSVARVTTDRGPASIHRSGGARMAEISAKTSAADLGRTLRRARALIASTTLPAGAVAEMSGQDEELRVSYDSLRLALTLALFLVYVVMAAQFESLFHPFVILLAVPLGLVGAIAALLVTGKAISVLVLIGTVMLAGIVVNNAIVLVDAVNRRRHEGQTLDDALIGAGQERLRPILMTTATTVLGLAPMALGLGAGDELRAPLAITVIGGLSVSTMLTLFLVPCLYRALSRPARQPAPVEERSGP